MTQEPANPDEFKRIKRRLQRDLLDALAHAAFSFFYPDCDVTLQFRNGQPVRVDIREINNLTQA